MHSEAVLGDPDSEDSGLSEIYVNVIDQGIAQYWPSGLALPLIY